MVTARDWALAALLISCGKPSPPVKPVVAPLPPAAPTIACADVLAIMQTDTEPLDELVEVCTRDAWSQDVLACIGKAADIYRGYDCMAGLTAEQRVGYAEIAANAIHEEDTSATGSDAYVTCEDGIHDTNLWDPPPVHPDNDAVELLAMLRKRALVQACNVDEWDEDVRRCLEKANDHASTNSCAAKLPPDKLQHAGEAIARVDDLVDRTVKGEKKPPTCAALVAKHYGDAAWKGKLAELAPAERKKLIAQSRTQMLTACGKWDAQLKACLFAGGDSECYAEGYDWTFPAVGVLPSSTSVAECDRYISTIAAFDKCTKLPEASRAQMREAMAQIVETFSNLRTLPEEQRKAMAESCKYGAEALQSVLTQTGC